MKFEPNLMQCMRWFVWGIVGYGAADIMRKIEWPIPSDNPL